MAQLTSDLELKFHVNQLVSLLEECIALIVDLPKEFSQHSFSCNDNEVYKTCVSFASCIFKIREQKGVCLVLLLAIVFPMLS